MSENRSIESQITSYIAGECTPAEQQAIAGLISTDQEYKSIYGELRQIWNSPVLLPVTDTFDIDAAWLKVSKHINESPLSVVHQTKAKQPLFMRILYYAASVAAVLLVAFTVYQVSHNNRAVYKSFASGKTVSSPVLLSDGSHIVLNAGSEVKYPEKFGSDGREVYFWGEAFFEIASDPTRPFVIETGDARIKVLGTSFNVKAYPNTGITEVVVNTGTVLFYHVDENDNILGQVILHKGDKGVYNRTTHKMARMQNDDLNFISWKTNILIFNSTSLDKVMAVVGDKYGVTFHIDSAELSHLKLTATFDNESLDSVLEVLRLVHKLQFTHNGKDYLVKKVTG
jgi:ferric-dicitrate binding protein FerR (iron transport regulator)